MTDAELDAACREVLDANPRFAALLESGATARGALVGAAVRRLAPRGVAVRRVQDRMEALLRARYG